MTVKPFCTPSELPGITRPVHNGYMVKKVIPRPKRPQYSRTFIRQWREHRTLTLEQLAERVGTSIEGGFTHASLSRIERGLQPYSQPVLEAIAHALQTDAASLLMRDPTDDEAIWTVWERAKQGDRQKIVDIARTIIGRTGTDE
jgi:transcriptional regulator with XRE-family HTH domain